MANFLKKKWNSLLAILTTLAVFGCAAINPATAPAPLAEIPASLNFPSSIEVDTSEVSAGAPSSVAFMVYQQIKPQVLPVGGEYFDAIVFGFTINDLINQAVGGILAELTVLDIPLNPITTTFAATSIFSGTDLKIDFADYDFDGDGQLEGCTGCTCPTGCDSVCPTQAPLEDLQKVCYRVWNDPQGNGEFVPLIAGFFDLLAIRDNPATPEDEENPGAGSFRVSLANQTFGPPPQITSYGADYNHRIQGKPLDLLSQYYFSVADNTGSLDVEATVSNVKVQQTALNQNDPSESQLLKTIQESVNQLIRDDPGANSTLQYVARYRTDFDFWSGTFQNFLLFPGAAFAPPPTGIDNFTNVCAQLSTAVGVDPKVCKDIGIDVSSIPFLELLLPTDPRVNLPADFPAVPTF